MDSLPVNLLGLAFLCRLWLVTIMMVDAGHLDVCLEHDVKNVVFCLSFVTIAQKHLGLQLLS